MRLYLLPVSTRRTLLYASRFVNASSPSSASTSASAPTTSYIDRGADFAARKWAQWEKMERGWQRKIVDYGNHAFRRIPFQEWGLKSVPPLSSRRRDDELRGRDKVELVFPPAAIPEHKAEGVLRTLATERQALHRQRLLWCFVGMPITAPLGLVPVIPNIPFFYLVYRAWSHWRAINGGKHVQWLIQNKLVQLSPSKALDQLYTKEGQAPIEELSGKEEMLITQKQIRDFSETLNLPTVEIELERAIWQVERALEKGEQEQQQQTGKSKEKDKNL
ncbi:mitochondrial K+-H+ exchange-related domain-containing protein [Trichoderma sp. SZMC 28014]